MSLTAETPARFPDNFCGDNAKLIASIRALLELDAKNALRPHGIGALARGLLSAAMHRLATPQPPKPAGAVPLPKPGVADADGKPFAYWPDQLRSYGDDREAAGRAVAVPRMEFTLREAKKLVAFFGDHDTRVTVELHPDRIDDDRMHFAGLYAHCTEYPEEGAEYLGPVEVQDEDDAAPIPQQPAAEGEVQFETVHRGGRWPYRFVISIPTPAADAGGVTEDMVLRACNAYDKKAEELEGYASEYPAMHAALTAALTPEVRHG